MPNILLTNICNLRCSYCFADDNINWKKKNEYEMPIYLYILYLKHLKMSSDNQVRLLWWEPLLHSEIKKILSLSYRWWFYMLIFSNFCLSFQKINDIFSDFPRNFFEKLTINVNFNLENTYRWEELDNMTRNIRTLKQRWANVFISCMIFYETDLDFIFNFAKNNMIDDIKFKPVNWGFIDTWNRKYGKLIYKIVKKYWKEFKLSFSCWLSKNILTDSEIEDITKNYKINLKFWCFANWWRYDIDIDGNIFRCFPLQKYYKSINLRKFYLSKEDTVIDTLNKIKKTQGNIFNCLWSKYYNK